MNFKKLMQKKIFLNMWQSLLFILVASLAATGLMFFLQPNSFTELFSVLKASHYIPFILNLLPILFLMLLVYFISNNTTIAVGSIGFLVVVMSLVNRFKLIVRQDPFIPVDLLLGREVLAVAKSFSTQMVIGIVVFLLIIIFIVAISFLLIKNKPMKIGLRIGGIVISLVIIVVGNHFIYSNKALFDSFAVQGNIYNRANQYNSKGFIYCFLYDLNTMRIEKPEGYNKAEIENHIAQAPAATPATTRPHVFVIMGEGYSDLALAEGISFEGYTDPMENYKKITEEFPNGYIVVPNVGGGTADTEFDVLTGVNTRDFRGLPYSYMMVKDEFDSLVTVFNSLGYDNVAIHPGHPWFYNRQNVYPWFGFEKFISLTEFDEADNKGMYINEEVTMDSVIDEYESHLATNPNVPFFDFCVTIQNHGPYKDKYLSETNFSSTLDLTEDDINAMSNYFEGMADADREIGRLTEYLQQQEEPAVVLYFGDHLPALSQNAYAQLIPQGDKNSLEEKTRLYRTPYFIWHNEAAEDMIFSDVGTVDGEVVSSFYLGGTLLQYLGFSSVDPFFAENYAMKQKYPVVMEEFYFTQDGTLHYNEDGLPEDLAFYKQWSYYRIFE